MSTSDAQQNREAQLKQAFQKHLPQRISAVQRRLLALCENGWDINTLHLTYLEAQNLAGSAGSYGLVDVSNKLFSLEQYLSECVESGTVPESEQEEKIKKLLVALNDYSAAGLETRESSRLERDLRRLKPEPLPAPEVELSGLPSLSNIAHFIRPPAGFIPEATGELVVAIPEGATTGGSGVATVVDDDLEAELLADDGEITLGDLKQHMVDDDDYFGDIEAAPAEDSDDDLAPAPDMEADFEDLDSLFESVESDLDTDESEAAAEQPEPSPAASAAEPVLPDRPDKLSIYFLHGGDETSRRLQMFLEDDQEVQSFTDPEEFIEVLSAIGPDAVIIDEAHLDRLDEIGPIVRKLRAKTHDQLPLIALSPQRDVATRLQLMRAGADAFLAADTPIDELGRRVNELLLATPENPYRVLVVEDDHSQALFAQSILRRAGMQARTEADPLQVIDVMEDFQPDLILMDLHMPGCDGMELTAIIRERDEFVNTPIVFLSGEEDEDTHFDALLAGGDDFLSKPIRPRHLVSAVKNRVRRARSMAGQATVGQAPDRANSVTGLVDRPLLMDRINQALVDFDPARTQRPGGVIYYEIDRPYDLRRELGLPAFESVSGELGPLLTQDLRDEDTATRYGDNAYCLLVPARSEAALQQRAHKTVERVMEYQFTADGRPVNLTVSAGICPLSVQFADAAGVIGAAERACNEESDQERGRVGLHRSEPDVAEDEDTRELGTLIMDALDHNRFQLVYQPIASLQGEDVEQYHCLLRLPRKNGPTIPPRELIQAAEELGMLDQIDRWVLKKSLAVLAGSGEHSKVIRLFVNQSLAATADEELPEWLIKSMESRRVPGSSLILEFKLPEIAGSLDVVADFMQALAPRRIRFCLGQFDGSDRAFEVLARCPAEFVKLSPELLADEHDDDDDPIKAVTDRLHEAGAMVIVPAVEEARSAVSLWSSGVDYIQGHFVQQPGSEMGYNFAGSPNTT